MSRHLATEALELPLDERLQLVEDIWDSIVAIPEALPLTEGEKQLIDERLDARGRDPNASSPWQDVYARITSRNR